MLAWLQERRRWPILFAGIVVAEVGVLVLAIFLYQGLTTGFAESIASNGEWATRLARYTRLSGIAADIVSSAREQLQPGSQGFDAKRFEAGVGRFGEQLEKARADLTEAPASGERDALLKDLDSASFGMKEFSAEAWVLSSFLRDGDDRQLTNRLPELNRDAGDIQESLARLISRARSAQKSSLATDESLLGLARRMSWLLAVLVAAVIGLLVVHAIRLSRIVNKAEGAAEAASRSKSAFLSHMSYAIRTPMNAIIGMTELVLDSSLTREQKGSLEVVKSSAETLLATLTNVLDYAKIQAGRLDLDVREFDVRSAVNDVIRTMAPRARRKGLELLWQLAPEVPESLRGDAKRLQQVLANLLDTAITQTDHGEIVVRGRSSAVMGDEVLLSFDVSDTGPGISAEERRGLLGTFRGAEQNGAGLENGFGLGLAVAVELVRMMNGRVGIDEAPGGGSVFRFTARFSIDPSRAQEIDVQQGNELHDLRILVLDDSVASRQILCAMLRGARAIPAAAQNAEEGMAMLRTAREADRDYPVALIDLELPGESAFELVKTIKSDPDLAGTILIALGVTGEPEESEQCRELGMDAVLAKPIRSVSLLDVIRGTLEARGMAHRSWRDGVGAVARSLRVLLADDNRVDRTLAVRLLEKRGHQVLAVESGDEAVALSERERFDVILMDVQMQQMDGLEATRVIRLREKRTGDHVPIIALTAHDMRGRCAEVGMDDYVTKPMDAQEVSDVISRNVPTPDGQSSASQMTSGGQRPFDEEAALERAGGERALLVELANMCLADTPAAVDSIRQGVAQRNPETVQRAAHKLKGSLLVLAADPASEAAYRLETMGAQGSLDQAAAALAALEQELERLKPVLSELAHSEAATDDD